MLITIQRRWMPVRSCAAKRHLLKISSQELMNVDDVVNEWNTYVAEERSGNLSI